MTKHMVHLGNGVAMMTETPNFIDPTDAKPRQPQVFDRRVNRERYERGLRNRAERLKRIADHIAARDELKVGPVAFMELRDCHCRWPVEGKLFCGAQRTEASPYCPAHHARSRQPV